jgi:hypothetical protein
MAARNASRHHVSERYQEPSTDREVSPRSVRKTSTKDQRRPTTLTVITAGQRAFAGHHRRLWTPVDGTFNPRVVGSIPARPTLVTVLLRLRGDTSSSVEGLHIFG